MTLFQALLTSVAGYRTSSYCMESVSAAQGWCAQMVSVLRKVSPHLVRSTLIHVFR